jgi:peptidoglycan hydrolase-like protein with peptidoglycan-binding domain
MERENRKPLELITEDRGSVAERFPFRHPLDTGDRGVLVLWAQGKLAEHGCYEGPLDGRYDREVSLAVRKFQDGLTLAVTGVIDRKTWDAL